MRIRCVFTAAALLALGGALLLAPPSLATSMQPLNLSDLVRESTNIVAGTVTAVSEGIDQDRMPYTEIQLKVSETIRGKTDGKLTFRQFGLQSGRPSESGRKYIGLIAGAPRYAVGDHVVLFLGPTSKIGLRTTVGLGQGHFVLRGGALQNDHNNSGLFRNLDVGKMALSEKEMSMVATEQGGVGADTFLGLVRRAVSEKLWDGPGPGKPSRRVPIVVPLTPAPRPSEGGSISE
jgi:hypothetical protein